MLARARAQGGARRPGRPALAGARPVRLPPGSRPPRRLRDALQARAQGAPPGRGRHLAGSLRATRRRSSRCSPPTTSTPPRPPRGRGRGRDQGEGARDARARRRARGFARRGTRGAALLRAGGRARRRRRCTCGELEDRAGRMAWRRGRGGGGTGAPRAGGCGLRATPASAIPAARISARLAEIDYREGQLAEAMSQDSSRRSRRSRRRSPTRTLADVAAQLGRLSRPHRPARRGRCHTSSEALGARRSVSIAREVFVEALTSKSDHPYPCRDRLEEARILLEGAARAALLADDLPAAAARAIQ